VNGFDTQRPGVKVLTRVLALAVGVGLAFIPVFLVLFTDKGGTGDYVVSLALVLGVYLLFGAAFGGLGFRTGAGWTPWLALPGVLIAAWLSRDEGPLWFSASVVAAIVLGAWGGTVLGATLRLRRQKTTASAR